MKSSIRGRIAEYYSAKVREHGATAAGVDWNSAESQEIRFDQLLKILPSEPSDYSILDYGCGYGALLSKLAKRSAPREYVGYDWSLDMVAQARKLHDKPYTRFTSDASVLEPCDYVVASGILNVKLDVALSDWESYVLDTIRSINRLARKGFAFNALTAFSDPERMRDDLYYANPGHLFEICVKEFTRHVAILHDYGLFEFTLLARKEIS